MKLACAVIILMAFEYMPIMSQRISLADFDNIDAIHRVLQSTSRPSHCNRNFAGCPTGASTACARAAQINNCELFPCRQSLDHFMCRRRSLPRVFRYARDADSFCHGLQLRQVSPCNHTNAPIPINLENCGYSCLENSDRACAWRRENGNYTCRSFQCTNDAHKFNCEHRNTANYSAIMNLGDSLYCRNLEPGEEGPCYFSPIRNLENCTRSCLNNDDMVCGMRMENGGYTCRSFQCNNDMDKFNCEQRNTGNYSAIVNITNALYCRDLAPGEEAPCRFTANLENCTRSCSDMDNPVCAMRSDNGAYTCRLFSCYNDLDRNNCEHRNAENDSGIMFYTNEFINCRSLSGVGDEGPCNFSPILENCTRSSCSNSDSQACALRSDNGVYTCRLFSCYNDLDRSNCEQRNAGNDSGVMFYTNEFANCRSLSEVGDEGPCNFSPPATEDDRSVILM